ncbi:PLP-dependent aminotransferase family protein [Paenibacillus sp. N4]|uniref:MocR-like pyridoxine biosynthesis transcription factor PdxR n=1 Tax=Paenibacillus vietnamensis TaxID=2590547 RepID=UPI001CD14E5F|nr:PLP-dependent aminotransferase family protein [Paenibacillus vietnamensis]MCA0753789.1 PLP-dependent aminotransferase family protein [Paenibacillus vietnamensis]
MKLGFTPLLDTSSSTPIYVQLYQYIRSQIENGSIGPGTVLTSIRQLAQHLSISKNTVETAYQQLLAEGYIQSRERNGYIVLPLEQLSESLEHHTAASEASESLHKIAAAPSKKIKYDFKYGDIELSRFPLAHWKKCMIEALSHPDINVLGYGDRQGHEGLRTEIADMVFQSRGISCKPEQIVLCAGTQHAVSLLCQLLQLREKTVGIEDPGYHGVRTVLRNHGCKLVPVVLEKDGISLESLRASGVDTVYVTPSHQFPLGMVLPVQKRLQLLQWAADTRSYIIEDDYDSEFRYNSKPIPSLKALDRQERVIYLGTFSKSFLPAARLSYIIFPPELLHDIQDELQNYSQAVSPIIQQAIWHFMRRGDYARHVRRMKRLYQAKHKALTAAISLYLNERTEMIGGDSGLHILLDVKGKSRSSLIDHAARLGCKVYNPERHWLDPKCCPDSYIMIGFGGLSEEELIAGIKLLNKAWFSA